MPCSRRPRLFPSATILLAAAVATAAAQDKPAPLRSDITVSAVTIAVTVQDRKGRYVEGLAAKDFTVRENGVRRPITYFRSDAGAPVGITVLLDVSGSMALEGRLDESRAALSDFAARGLGPKDEAALLLFADGDVEVAAPLARDRSLFRAELDKAKAYGQTALHDAVAVSPDYARRVAQEKRALLLVTDGIENGSESTVDQALEIARRADVPIYVVGYKIPRAERDLASYKKASALTAAGIAEVLRRFAEATGGTAFFLDDASGLPDVLAAVRRELGRQYIIGYTTTQEQGGDYRRITVVTSDRHHRVRTRQGY